MGPAIKIADVVVLSLQSGESTLSSQRIFCLDVQYELARAYKFGSCNCWKCSSLDCTSYTKGIFMEHEIKPRDFGRCFDWGCQWYGTEGNWSYSDWNIRANRRQSIWLLTMADWEISHSDVTICFFILPIVKLRRFESIHPQKQSQVSLSMRPMETRWETGTYFLGRVIAIFMSHGTRRHL